MLKCRKGKSLLCNEKGQGMVEYGLILTFIALVVVGIMSMMGIKVSTFFTIVSTAL